MFQNVVSLHYVSHLLGQTTRFKGILAGNVERLKSERKKEVKDELLAFEKDEDLTKLRELLGKNRTLAIGLMRH